MSSKIKSVSIVCQQGVNSYRVGNEYNGLSLHRIDGGMATVSGEGLCMYKGFTLNEDLVFETFNAPVDIEYERDEQ